MESSTPETTFRPREGSFRDVRRLILLRTLPIFILALGIGVTISTLQARKDESRLDTLPFVLPIVAIAAGFGLFRGINRQRGAYESYALSVTPETLTRYQLNTPTVRIQRGEVRSIVRDQRGGYTIRGSRPTDLILVPSGIDNPAALQAALEQWAPIAGPDSLPLRQRQSSLLVIGALALMAVVYLSYNKVLVGVGGTALVALLGWSLYETQRSKNIDRKTRRESLLSILVIVSVIGVMIAKLGGALHR